MKTCLAHAYMETDVKPIMMIMMGMKFHSLFNFYEI